VCDRDGGALYFSRLPIPCKRDGEPDVSAYLRHIGIYAYRGGFLKRLVKEPPCALELTESLEQLRAMWLGARIAVIETAHAGAGVDTPEDVANVEALLRQRGLV
jgi:3-deoxy-manno-octulosonate cytidylyltransferase (CMP-KDO synthetase)